MQPVRAAPCGRPTRHGTTPAVYHTTRTGGPMWPPHPNGGPMCDRRKHHKKQYEKNANRRGGPMWPPNTPRYDTRREPYNPYGRPHVAVRPNGGPVWPPRNIIKTIQKKCEPYGRPHVAARPNGGPMWPPRNIIKTIQKKYNPYGRPHVAAPPEWRPHVVVQHATVRHPPCTIQPVRAARCGRPTYHVATRHTVLRYQPFNIPPVRAAPCVIVANIIKNNTKKMRTVGAAPCGRPTRHGTTPAVNHTTRTGGPMWPSARMVVPCGHRETS